MLRFCSARVCSRSFAKKLFLEPQPLFHAAVQKLADGHKVGVLVPMEEQIAQGYQFWGRAVWMWKSPALRPTAPLIGIVKRQKRPSGRELAFLHGLHGVLCGHETSH